jgi:hypothetical protein
MMVVSFKSTMTDILSGAGPSYPFEAPEFTPLFQRVRVAQSLIFCFVDSCFSFYVGILFSVLRLTASICRIFDGLVFLMFYNMLN